MSVSSDLIPVSGSSEVAVSALKLSGKKELVSEDAVASWLEVAISGKELLTSVITSTVKKRHRGESLKELSDSANIYINTVVGAASIGTSVGVFATLFSHSDVANPFIALSPLFISVSITGIVLHVSQLFTSRKYRTIWNKLITVQSEGTRKWLQERYGVTVSDEVLTVLASDVLTNQKSTPFTGSEGQLWVLRRSSSGLYQVEPQQIAVQASEAPEGIRQAPVMLSVGAAHLDSELGELGEKIDTRLAQLQKFALTVEESHVVSRTVGDARDAVAAFERLQLLGAEESGSAYLLDVLRLLDSELESIVQVKVLQETELLRAGKQKAIARQVEVGV